MSDRQPSTIEEPQANNLTAASEATDDRFTISTLFRYLIGNRQAIHTAAASPHTVWIGGLLVASAAFAREYDGEDLLREPWHLLIPHAASLATSLLLYCMIALPSAFWQKRWGELATGYRTFLGLFWLTAPLAWLYAVPIERFVSAGSATAWNLRFLGIVSVWRVVLITRVLMVSYEVQRWKAIATVLCFGDAVMLVALRYAPAPVLMLMGGIRLTESESIIQGTQLLLMLIGMPALVLLGCVYLGTFARPGSVQRFPSRQHDLQTDRATWALVATACICWLFILPMTQREQQNRYAVESAVESLKFDTALAYLSEREPTDFPPHWTPPPHIAFPNQPCEITDVMKVMLNRDVAPWVYGMYLSKFQRQLENGLFPYGNQDLTAYVEVLEILPIEQWANIETRRDDPVRYVLSNAIRDENGPETNKRVRKLLEKLDAYQPITHPDLQ